MKSNKWIFVFLLVFVGIAFVSWGFFFTSRMILNIKVIYPEEISEQVAFDVKVISDRFDNDTSISPQEKSLEYKSLPFGDYFFEISLDDRLLVKEFHSFQPRFSFQRIEETITLDISDLANIASVNYKIVDPYLTLKWTGKYIGGYKPAEYLIRMNESERVVSVNYIEVDILRELLAGREKIDLEIIPLTRNGEGLLSYEYEIPIRLESVYLDIPEGFNIYDMSINIQEKQIPVDPYDPKITFPVIDLDENKIPFEIYYYEDRIWKSELDLSEAKEIVKIPKIPEATVTGVEINESTVTLHLDIVRDEEFLYNRFSHFELLSHSFKATTTEDFTYKNENTMIEITPLFDPDIIGQTLSFIVPNPPQPELHTYMYDEQLKFTPSIKIFSNSNLTLSGTLTIDNSKKIVLPDFTQEFTIHTDFEMDEVHLIEVLLEDSYSQKAQKTKWISTSVPETTFFTKYVLSQDQILTVSWDPLSIYSDMELIVTDNYNIKRFYPENSEIQTNLSGTLLREPLKVIIKGFFKNEEYTAAIVEDIKSE